MDQRRAYPAYPLVGVGVLIVRRGRILLVRRRNPPDENRWAMPGGLVELGETITDAARREAREELGVSVRITELVEISDNVILDRLGRAKYHFILVDFAASAGTGRVRLNAESSEFGWFTADEVESLETAGKTRPVALRFMRRLRRHSPHSARRRSRF
jgi:ADP-ribose pyrophosphatase YjhB (NUDIX family)